MNKKSFALILVVIVIVVLGILGMAILSRSVSEARLAQKNLESTQAFWLAEAGASKAIKEIRSDYTITGTGLWDTAYGKGGWNVTVSDTLVGSETRKRVVAHGFIPFANPRVERVIEVVLRKSFPTDFFDWTIYSAGDVDINGNSFTVVNTQPSPDNKAIKYADAYGVEHPENVNGITTYDSSIRPLGRFDFQDLLSKSQTQQNVYVYTGQGQSRKLVNQYTGSEAFPESFWFSEPTDPNDPTTGTPNVVYIMGDLTIKQNMGTVGGFYVVVGDVINQPDVTQTGIIEGSGTINGAIYTRGSCLIHGGGNEPLNINGGIWAGEEARLTGGVNAAYNSDYMSAIEAIVLPDVQVISWREEQSAYEILP